MRGQKHGGTSSSRKQPQRNIFVGGCVSILLCLGIWYLLSLRPRPTDAAAAAAVENLHTERPPLPEGKNVAFPLPPHLPVVTPPSLQSAQSNQSKLPDLKQPPTLPPIAGPLAASASERKKTALAMATAMIGPIIDTIGLSAEKKSLVLDAMAEHQTRVEDGIIRVHQGKTPPNLDELKSIDRDRDQSLKEILGETDFAKFTDLVSTRVERNLVTSVSEHLNQSGEPLTSEQQSDMLRKLIPVYREAQSQAQDVSRTGTVNRRMDALGEVIESADQRLSETQKKAIQSFMNSQREDAQKGL